MNDGEFPALFSTEMSRRRLLERLGVGAAIAMAGVKPLDALAARHHPARVAGGDVETINWGLDVGFPSLDLTHNTSTLPVLSNCLEGLLTFDVSGRLRPLLAESWKQPDAKTYVYTIRQGVKFWDGTPLTVGDVVASLSRHLDPKVASAFNYTWSDVTAIEATGANEVTIRLKRPSAFFRYSPVTGLGGYVISKSFLDAHPEDIGTPSVLTMGTGPYKIESFAPDESVVLVRNDLYWGTKPAVKRAVMKSFSNPLTRVLAMRSGEIDGANRIGGALHDQYKRISGVKIASAPSGLVAFVSMDVDGEPWSDPNVRRAVAYCVDKPGLVASILHGRGRPAVTIPAPELWAGLGVPLQQAQAFNRTLPQYGLNLAKARQSLAQSSVPKGFRASLSYSNRNEDVGKACLSIAENAKQIGIRFDVKQVDHAKFFADTLRHGPNRDIGIRAHQFYTDFPDAADNPWFMLNGEFAVANQYNYADYANPAVTRLLRQNLSATSLAVRVRTLQDALRRTANDVPYIPLWWQAEDAAIESGLAFRNSTFYFMTAWLTQISSA